MSAREEEGRTHGGVDPSGPSSSSSSRAKRALSRRDLLIAGGGVAAGAAAAAIVGRLPELLEGPERLIEWGPDARVWGEAPVRELALVTAPPFHPVISGSAAHTRMWVQALGTADEVYVRLEWEDMDKHDRIVELSDYSDAVAIQFPRDRDAATSPMMGTREKPVNTWYWRANWEKAQNLVAEGGFTITPASAQDVEVSARHADGRWVVVFRRRREPGDGASVNLAGVRAIPAAFALWEGANREANGFKAVTREATEGRWVELAFAEPGRA